MIYSLPKEKEMVYTIPKDKHDSESLKSILAANPQIRFVSLVAVDIYGHDTDEKIPVGLLLKDPDKFLSEGVMTDGSSVLLPLIADISDASVKLVPDKSVNWFVDYNYDNYDAESGLPIGTLRIPAFLCHNDTNEVGSRVILRDTLRTFKDEVMALMMANPYIFKYLPIESISDIASIELTSATELEFYVRTPHEVADKEKLVASQEMKEQYWKRTLGPVRTALENTLEVLDKYGIDVEMGHKEVGGAKAQLTESGGYEHIMEQLEIDWKYSDPMQAADNDFQVRDIVGDIFTLYGLDVTFAAKPVEGIAGSGKHTHFGVVAKLKNGKTVNLFAPNDPKTEYLSPIGFGAIMGLLKNYEIVNPIANCTSDSLRRLKPGYEAPISIVTGLGKSVAQPSRNRTVLACIIRDPESPMSTRFELRSPNPKSNTYLVISACLLSMLDGIKAVLNMHKNPDELYNSLSKAYGDPDFYLEEKRVYRAEGNIFTDYTEEERSMLFGPTPKTVWENLKGFDLYPEKAEVLYEGNSFSKVDLESFKVAALDLWTLELHDRLVPSWRNNVKKCCVKLHTEESVLDDRRFEAITALAKEIAQDTEDRYSILTRLSRALEEHDYDLASSLQVETLEKVAALEAIYTEYKKNILC
ncbi:MAG: glutamine synthetase [Clostridia bacterium]|nr:glutamine synthetase [Clostridia bacterium]